MPSSVIVVFLILLVSSLANVANCLDQDVTNAEIMARIKALENKERDQTRLLEQYRTDLSDLQDVVGSQGKRLQHQDTLLRRYAKRVNRLEQKLTRMNQNQADTKQTHDDSEADVEDAVHDNINTVAGIQKGRANNGRINRAGSIQRRIVNWSPVFFHAVIINNTHVTNKKSLVFPHVVASAGGGYDNTTGVFTATRAGVYSISLSVMSVVGHYVYVEIVQDGRTLARAGAEGGTAINDQGSITVPTMMEAGDAVWARVYNSNGNIEGYSYSSFMALLVNPSL